MRRFDNLCDLRDFLRKRVEDYDIDYDIIISGDDPVDWYYNLYLKDSAGQRSALEENVYYMTMEEIQVSSRNVINLRQWLRMSPALGVPVRIQVRSGDDYWNIAGIYEDISDVDQRTAGDLFITAIGTCWIHGSMHIDLKCRN